MGAPQCEKVDKSLLIGRLDREDIYQRDNTTPLGRLTHRTAPFDVEADSSTVAGSMADATLDELSAMGWAETAAQAPNRTSLASFLAAATTAMTTAATPATRASPMA